MKKLIAVLAAAMTALCLAGCVAESITYPAGVYEVGQDIEPGRYVLEPTGNGHVRVFDQHGNTLTDEWFGEDFSISTKNGQTVFLENAKLNIVEISTDATGQESGSDSKTEEGKGTDEKSSDAATKYPAGTYKVGEDIPSGSYLFTREPTEEFLMIYVWDNFTTDDPNEATINQWATEDEYFLRIAEGQTIKVQNGTFSQVEYDLDASTMPNSYPAGLYQVGVDIPSGGYLLVKEEDEEFLMIDVWDNFSTDDANDAAVHQWATENEYFQSVSDGQVLRVQHGTFSQG